MALPLIARAFARRFEKWNFTLPEEDLERRRRGVIVGHGWALQYAFGRDDERGEHLDYYGTHRMSNDEHVRIWEDGEVEGLPGLQTMRRGSRDPEEDRRLQEELDARNRAVAEEMERKGFGLSSLNQLIALSKPDSE